MKPTAIVAKKTRFRRRLRLTSRKSGRILSRPGAPKPLDVNAVIRKSFDLIEGVIRVQYVQLGNAYIDVLTLALGEKGYADREGFFDFPLALELGVATRAGWSFMELGLSRIAAPAVDPHHLNTRLTVQQAWEWPSDLDVEPLRLVP